jgi:acetyl-CoA C-acetyltransferase
VTIDPRTPCVIGVARRTWREEPAPEPVAMWEDVARAAAADAGSPQAVRNLESLQIVYCQSWQYDDPCGRLAHRLGADPRQRTYSGLGGSVPLRLVGDLAAAMLRGELDLGLVVGAEALATRRRLPDQVWSYAPDELRPFPIELERNEAAHGIYQAYLTFALLDTARRGCLGRTPAEHQDELGHLLAPLTEVAASDPEHAWFPIAREAAEITTPSVANRMVATPYTKLMTAIMDVDMAAAVLIATEDSADRLGVPAERRVYLHGLGLADEPPAIAARPDLGSSPALRSAGLVALAGLGIDAVAHLDLYSCFASSLAFARDALGIIDERSLSVTGGLPYHGGPGSNYCTHALAAMVDVLRADPGSYGLVTGVGMHMTHHGASLWSTVPGAFAPPGPLGPPPATEVVRGAQGPARVATFSTVYNRQGPEWSAFVCDLPDGTRCYARLEEPVAGDVDLVGATVTLAPGARGGSSVHL